MVITDNVWTGNGWEIPFEKRRNLKLNNIFRLFGQYNKSEYGNKHNNLISYLIIYTLSIQIYIEYNICGTRLYFAAIRTEYEIVISIQLAYT